MKKVQYISLLLVSLFLLVTSATADTIQVQKVQVNSIGATMPVNIILDTSTTGIAGYDITVSLSNPSVATITNVSFPSWAILNESTTFPASSVRLRTVDLYEKVNSGATNVLFGTLTLRGDAVGSTDIVVTIKNITSDDGSSVTPVTQSGKFTVGSGGTTPPSPASPVKLIFIHHSTGENWLADGNGGLGVALRDHNYFVSDTNYGWGPNTIGSSTDIGNWYDWFRGPSSATYLAALYSESGQHSTYSRLASDPGGLNKIVMFKSCFPNSALGGNPNDPVPSIATNPMKSQSVGSTYTVANAKGIYNDLLNYFATRQDTLFIVITAPPLIDTADADNARAFNQWLVNDWLKNYPYKNVYVFDFYNVLTTNGGNANTNDLNSADGNHHRWWNGVVQHQVIMGHNVTAYPTGDSHPSQAGNLKATAEFVPLLNYAYNQWTGSTITPLVADFTANKTSGSAPLTVKFTDTSTGNPTSWNWSFGDGILSTSQNPLHTYSNAGTFTVSLNATNAGGSNLMVKTGYITVTYGGAPSKVGVFRNGVWYLDYDGDTLWNPAVDKNFWFGDAGYTPVVGDWSGNGKTKIGLFNGTFYLDYNGDGIFSPGVDRSFQWTFYGFTPIIGDWNGDGRSKVGTFKDGVFYLDYDGNGIWNPSIDKAFPWTTTGFIPIVGDWNGDGRSKIGTFKDGVFYLDYDGNGIWNPSIDKAFPWTTTGFIPFSGDWNGDGKSKVGTFKEGVFYLDYDGNGIWNPSIDKAFPWTTTGFTPIVGDWNGGGKSAVGTFKDGAFYLDYDGDGTWNPGVDKSFMWTTTGFFPIVGKWS